MNWAFLYLVALHAWVVMAFFFTELPSPRVDLSITWQVFGWALAALGFTLRIWSIHTLGRYFTFQIGIRENHSIVRLGPYRRIRHPSYTGYLMFLFGACVSTQSLTLLVLGWIPAVATLMVRVHKEEKMLKAHFRDDYLRYIQETGALLPWF